MFMYIVLFASAHVLSRSDKAEKSNSKKQASVVSTHVASQIMYTRNLFPKDYNFYKNLLENPPSEQSPDNEFEVIHMFLV